MSDDLAHRRRLSDKEIDQWRADEFRRPFVPTKDTTNIVRPYRESLFIKQYNMGALKTLP